MRTAMAMLAALALSACNESAGKAEAPDQALLQAMLNPSTGATQIRKSVEQVLTVRDGYVAIRNYDVEVVRIGTPWSVHCDHASGVSVEFASPVQRDQIHVDVIEGIAPSYQDCVKLSLETAKVIEAMLAGR